ncbi:MAG: MoeA family protein, partial [Anaerolineae bacterium]
MTLFKTQSSYPIIPFEEAMRILLDRALPLPARECSLDQVISGTVIAQDVVASAAVPGFDASTMDGYAVLSRDGNTHRRVLGEQQAGGAGTSSIGPGECVRIMTGAPLPGGADAVIPVEFTREEQGVMLSDLEVRPGQNVRPSGSDVSQGQLVLPAGSVLGPAEIGLLAALGHYQPLVYPSPRVAVL